MIELPLQDGDEFLALTGNLHLGVIYLKQEEFIKARAAFLRQGAANEIAENQYYLALTCKALKMYPEYKAHLQEAKRLYLEYNRLNDVYVDPVNKVYLGDIESEIKIASTFGLE